MGLKGAYQAFPHHGIPIVFSTCAGCIQDPTRHLNKTGDNGHMALIDLLSAVLESEGWAKP